MKKIVFLLILSFMFLKLHPQAIGFFGSGILNTNYHFKEYHRENLFYFPAKLGVSGGLGFEFFKIAGLPVRITCSFENLKGGIICRDYGLGGGSDFSAIYNKQSLGFGIQLLNVITKDNVKISIGGTYNLLINEKLNGYSYSWAMSTSSTTKTYNENDIKLSKNDFGLIETIGYEKNISKDFYITPQLSLYFGLNKEFNNSWINWNKSPWAFRVLFQMSFFKRTKYLFEVPKVNLFKSLMFNKLKISSLNHDWGTIYLFEVYKLNLFKNLKFNKLKNTPLYPD